MSDRRTSDDEGEVRTARRTRRDSAAPAEAPAPAPETREDAPATDAKLEDWYDGEPPDAAVERTDDGRPKKQLFEMKRQRALADINKPIEPAAEAIWSMEPDKVKARAAVEEAYRKAARTGTDRDSEGELRARYRAVDDKFNNAAADMLRVRDYPERSRARESGETAQLVRWIDTCLTGDNARVRTVLRQRKQVAERLTETLGERERRRQGAAEVTKRWETAFARWSAPDKEIAAMIASYADRIDQLNADINTGNNRDQAIFSFWFEVAPVHLQLRPKPVTPDNTPGVGLIREELSKEFPDFEDVFESGVKRNDGSLYLIDPEGLAGKRRDVLKEWQEAAADQARAEAAYTTRPDSAGDLRPRHDKLKGDGWIKGTREALAAPKP